MPNLTPPLRGYVLKLLSLLKHSDARRGKKLTERDRERERERERGKERERERERDREMGCSHRPALCGDCLQMCFPCRPSQQQQQQHHSSSSSRPGPAPARL